MIRFLMILVLISFIISGLTGCAYWQPSSKHSYAEGHSSIYFTDFPGPSPGDRSVKGSQSYIKLFGFINIGSPDWGRAVQSAREKAGGDQLKYVTVYEKSSYALIGSVHSINVTGYTSGNESSMGRSNSNSYSNIQASSIAESPSYEVITVNGLKYGSTSNEVKSKLGNPDRIFDFGTGERWNYDKKHLEALIYDNKLVSIMKVKY